MLIGQKRPRDRLCIVSHSYDSFNDCFTSVDCIKSLQNDHSVFEVNWSHDDFLKLLQDVPMTTCDEHMQSFQIITLHQAMKCMPHDFKFINQPEPVIMTKSCSCCKADIKNTIHTCGEVLMSSDYHVFASLTFEKRFDFNLCDNEYISTTNLTMVDTDSDLFFYSIAKDNTPVCHGGGGKDMNAL